MERALTIGIYEWDAPRWMDALQGARCDQVVDIRARPGVRGSEYAFANKTRLEAALSQAGIAYLHLPESAQSKEIRDALVAADRAGGVLKRDRTTASPSSSATSSTRYPWSPSRLLISSDMAGGLPSCCQLDG